jgi:chlorophyll(ide) b reductase
MHGLTCDGSQIVKTSRSSSQVVATNLMGSLICTKEAIRTMQSQKTGGHVFNMDGNGSGGNATPQYAV